MKSVRIACKLYGIVILLLLLIPSNVFASLTKEQGEDVALFATTFIEKGNERRDEEGYPLLVYALSNNWKTSVEIRRSGYKSELYHVKNNNYHMKNGKYLDLGLKWCMDCGDYISYVYNTTLGLDMYLEEVEDPWHIKDMYADANKYDDSEIFEFVYKNVPISSIDEAKLELGDVVIRMGSRENHGLIYVGDGMKTAHASRNGIKYSKNPPILGFEVVQLNRFYKTSTIVSIIRVKNGVVDENQNVNSTIVWPDTGKEETLIMKEQNKIRSETVLFEGSEYNLSQVDIQKLAKKNEEIITSEQLSDNYELYIKEISKYNNSPEYLKRQIMDWAILEFKRILIVLCA